MYSVSYFRLSFVIFAECLITKRLEAYKPEVGVPSDPLVLFTADDLKLLK